jgi:ATP-binding cassette subfamily F protein 3
MFTAHHINKSFGINQILSDITFSINAGECVGLIGPNGCGKTTLVRILAGIDEPDSGTVQSTIPDLRIGYLAQGFEPEQNKRVGDLIEEIIGSDKRTASEIEKLAKALAENPTDLTLQGDYDSALARYQDVIQKPKPEPIFNALGLTSDQMDRQVSNLSGGQKTRLALALTLLKDPNFLLLDEPTNHLDIQMLEWLESWLVEFNGAALVVSHDRTFLDRTVRRILDLDPETHQIRGYTGNYTQYFEQYLSELDKQMAAYRDQVYEIRRIEQDIAQTKRQAHWVEQTTTSREPIVRRYAKKVAKKAKSREKKLKRYLKSDDLVEKPKQSWQMKLEFNQPAHLGQDVLKVENLSVGYSVDYPLLTDVNLCIRVGQRIALTGPNGGGKTTFLRTIAGDINPLVGLVNLGHSVHLGYMTQEQESLNTKMTALETIQHVSRLNETEARSMLHYFLFSGDDPLRKVENLSHGERSRLMLAVLVAQGSNFLILDEPINHLDIPSRERFEMALSQFDGTIIAVVHDRYFIERFATDVWILGNGKIEQQV